MIYLRTPILGNIPSLFSVFLLEDTVITKAYCTNTAFTSLPFSHYQYDLSIITPGWPYPSSWQHSFSVFLMEDHIITKPIAPTTNQLLVYIASSLQLPIWSIVLTSAVPQFLATFLQCIFSEDHAYHKQPKPAAPTTNQL